ncbi:MAG: hypothetical protein ACYDEB_14045 [Dehalococcoidia bacterium]
MHLLWKRYTRSGFAPPWFYAAMAAGFLALAVWGGLQANWPVMGIALVMVPVTLAGARVMQRLSAAAEASRREIERRRKDGDHG